jgi:hypothetical protein
LPTKIVAKQGRIPLLIRPDTSLLIFSFIC